MSDQVGTDLYILEISREQAELLMFLDAPVGAVSAAFGLEIVKSYLQTEMLQAERERIPLLVSPFFLDWVLVILETVLRPPYIELGQYTVDDLRDFEVELKRIKSEVGTIPFPELAAFLAK